MRFSTQNSKTEKKPPRKKLSRLMSRKFRATVKLEPGQAYIVGNLEDFEHIASVYRALAADANTDDDAAQYESMADWVQMWAHNTAFLSDEEEAEWN